MHRNRRGNRTPLALLVATVALLAPLAAAAADEEVVLASGDKIAGSFKQMQRKKLSIETAYAGVLEIDWTKVASLRCDKPAAVWLRTGERHEGTLAPGSAPGKLVVQPASGSPVEVDLAQVRQIRLLGASWSGFLEVAARDTEGNSSTVGALLNGEIVRTTESDEIKAKGSFRYGENADAVSERNWYTLGRYRHAAVGPVFVYVSAEFMQDSFKGIDLNTILSAGLGMTLLEEDWADLSAEAGAAYVRNSFSATPDESHVAGRVAADGRFALPFGFELTDSVVYVPNFEETNDWQARNEAALAREIMSGWKARLGMILEYDNRPEPDRQKDDETYFVGLGYKF